MHEDPKTISFPCLKMTQSIGEFYIGTINCKTLSEITYFDVRRILKEKRDVETYLGIQRPLNKNRVSELKEYVGTIDACFPTSIILAIPGVCADYDEDKKKMSLSNYLEPQDDDEKVFYRAIAKVLDGQHRIEGLSEYTGEDFELNVSIFIDIDLAQQAYIFSTVNLAQTKVNKSLVYDLYDLAKSRSPQKVCHNIAVGLDQHEDSPLYQRIKRLGRATEGRYFETITQATFVQSLMKYISKTELLDRDIYMRGGEPAKCDADESEALIFRNMMIDEKDLEIADVLWNFFDAVKERWPVAWNYTGRGNMLNKTNGFRGLMRFLHNSYLHLTGPGGVPGKEEFYGIFSKIDFKDEDFTTEKFKPGSSGEAELFRQLKALSGIE